MQGVHTEGGGSGPNWFKWAVVGVGTASVLLCLYWGYTWFRQNHQEPVPVPPAAEAPGPAATTPEPEAAPSHPLAPAEPARGASRAAPGGSPRGR